jgi:hypothetical protein
VDKDRNSNIDFRCRCLETILKHKERRQKIHKEEGKLNGRTPLPSSDRLTGSKHHTDRWIVRVRDGWMKRIEPLFQCEAFFPRKPPATSPVE